MKIFTKYTYILLLITSFTAKSQIDSNSFSQLINKEPSVEINLGAAMLGMLSAATKNEEQGVASLLSSLDTINVVVYDLENADKLLKIRSQIITLADVKIKQGFEKIATVKEEDSLVYILAETDEKSFKRISIYALDDDEELVLIEIKGSILISQIGDLMNHFDVDINLNGLDLNKDKKK